jgi:hypothetical protein
MKTKGVKHFLLRSPALLFLSILFTLHLLHSTIFAVTYNTDPANGPETLITEVTQSFEAWKVLDNKLEISPVTENPESLFQYGASERFSPDTLSITIQKQKEARQLIHLVSPNTDNRKRILLHEVGIAIGLTPQHQRSLANESQVAAENPLEGDDASKASAEDSEATSTDETTTDESTENTTENTEDTNTSEDSNSTAEEGDDSETDTQDDASTESEAEGSETDDSSSAETDITKETTETSNTEESTVETTATETPEPLKSEALVNIKPWETVMNPSIHPDDPTELGNGEKELLKALNLFAKEDINKDGNVNFYDLVAIAQAFGQRNVNDPSDISKDGIVNQTDIDLLRKVYTFSDPSATAPGTPKDNPEGQSGPETTTTDGGIEDEE